MRWTVEGADKQTGDERTIEVEANSRADAEKLAAQRGILVSRVLSAGEVNAAQLEALAAMQGERVWEEKPTIAYATPSPTPSAIETTVTDRPYAPNYAGLQVASILFWVLWALAWVGGLVLLGIAIVGSYRTPLIGAGLFFAFFDLIVSFVSGCIFMALASGCEALRDMARNSWR